MKTRNVIKGKRSVMEALKAETSIKIIYVGQVQQRQGDIQQLLKMAKEAEIPVQVVTPEHLESLAGEENTQGICAVLDPVSFKTLAELKVAAPKIVLATDHLQDPYNFGAILRTCDAFGVTWVVFPKDRSAPVTPGVIKASSGAYHHLNLCRVTNLGNALTTLKDSGYWVYGTAMNNGEDLGKATPHFPLVIVVGNEERGLSDRIGKLLDGAYYIPMVGHVDSLNVSVAAGIALYTLSRQCH
jgi:23S rRNA (guanosine2251-2'-O)-methyltransferase